MSRGPILIGFGEALAAPEAALSLLGGGLPIAAFARRGARPALRRHPNVDVYPVTAPEDDAAATVADVRALAHRIGAMALMPLDDGAVWTCERAARELGLPVIGATGAQADIALDKTLQLEAARAAGLSVPETVICRTQADALALDRFPMVLRPALAVEEQADRLVKGDGRVCANRSELEAAVAGWTTPGPLLAQPRVRGTGEGLFGIATAGGVKHFSAHRRLRMVNPQGSGSSACVSAPVDPALAEAGARMLEAIGWHGLFMLELLRDDAGTAWFIELNGRTWGSLALARRQGLEYPLWAARQALGIGPVPEAVDATAGTVVARHLGREILHVVSVMRGPRSAALSDWPSRGETLRAVARVRRGERWYNWSARHPAMFVDDTLRTVFDAVARFR